MYVRVCNSTGGGQKQTSALASDGTLNCWTFSPAPGSEYFRGTDIQHGRNTVDWWWWRPSQRAPVFIPKVPFPTEWFKNNFFGIPSSIEVRVFVNVDSLITSQFICPSPDLFEIGAKSRSIALNSLRPEILESKQSYCSLHFSSLTLHPCPCLLPVGFLCREPSLYSAAGEISDFGVIAWMEKLSIQVNFQCCYGEGEPWCGLLRLHALCFIVLLSVQNKKQTLSCGLLKFGL